MAPKLVQMGSIDDQRRKDFLNLPSDSIKNVMYEDTFVHRYCHLMFEEVFSRIILNSYGPTVSLIVRRNDENLMTTNMEGNRFLGSF